MLGLENPSGHSLIDPITTEVFWGEVAPCDHWLQLYDDDERFLDSLARFVSGGLDKGDGIVVIATAGHRQGLRTRLRKLGYDVEAAIRRASCIQLDTVLRPRGRPRNKTAAAVVG